ncbi:MAG: TonB-dependent receptor, partial [Thermoanaerobaculia bacterium]|nr:TonB-dependent receptor [Thermoanaerobaculia bacterium]
VVRGPSSTYYGSDALGGVVQLFPRVHERLEVAAGYQSQGDENYQAIGWGRDGWSLGLARRHAISAETPDGDRIPSGFEQFSGTLRRRWESGGLSWDTLLLGSAGREIEKASTDFPDRITIYPEENHLLLKLGVTGESGWTASVYAHPNDLVTDVLRPGESRSLVENESTELGASFRQRFFGESNHSVAVGAEYFGRRGVDAIETDIDLSGAGSTTTRRTLDGAEEDQLGAYGAFEWHLGEVNLTAGLRGTWQRQANEGFSSRDDTALSGFVGTVAPLGGGFELVANVGSGLRFPTLSERFFSGTTGRGGVIGNPDLDAERSLSADLGLRWFGERLFVSGYVFRNEIDDYIERVEVADDLLSFVNLTSGRIQGLELAGSYSLRPAVSLSFGGHLLDGESDEDQPLADVPADRLHLGLDGSHRRWTWAARLEHRTSKSEVGEGERPIPAADLVSASVGFDFGDGFTLTVSGENLLDEAYFNSADDKVPLAAGRSVGVTVRWRQP